MRKIMIICPICATRKFLPLTPDALKCERGSILYWEIQPNSLCEHHFYVLMDYHFKVRDYELHLHESPLNSHKRILA